jgi:hypothetical protein
MPAADSETPADAPRPKPPADTKRGRRAALRGQQAVDEGEEAGLPVASGARVDVDLSGLGVPAGDDASDPASVALDNLRAHQQQSREQVQAWLAAEPEYSSPSVTTRTVVDGEVVIVPIDAGGREAAIAEHRKARAEQAERLEEIEAEHAGKTRCPI